ncbi:3-hydroxyacyl-CoA dehydrogenase NAD-binding domain-containing protein [Oceanibacterium hippocampi]|uniref:Fatty acid oxidation complex subunit alpha n=1 Tax=Oceanibacterium hippocampi TaxID=745714 RepID=A0A1Y5RZ70_9PROT|nr:3-hydroxyacyl-CoA dehydrogenase NAD-binding domain-containing protein [Oceanibacterium hippocampi]SLN29049.1 Fatty acid oxidation complex subunit alpha [Oceanibacterium hippocampi]
MINYSVDSDGIATISWDMPGRSMNVLNDQSLPAFIDAVDKAIADDAVKGVVITSGKADFIAGADLEMLQGWSGAADAFASVMNTNRAFRRMETSGKPFAAAINGTALGGGFEICLACHYRVAADKPKAQIGLPESQVGLLPGGGGTQRLPRLIGIQAALPLILEGKRLNPAAAAQAGLVHKVVPAEELMAEARRWIREEGAKGAAQPWDSKSFKLPGGPVQSPKGMQTFVAGNAMLRQRTMGNYPALNNIMSAVYHGCQVDIDTGLKIEARQFVATVQTPEAKNMIRSLFFGMGEANKLADRPAGVPKQAYSRVGILGAGMMGAGIAFVTALAGIEVVLIDTEQAAAERGKAYSEGLLKKRVAQGRMAQAEADAVLARITPTTDYAPLKGAEMVIEAVFERRDIKAEVTRKAEAVLAADAVFASNTSTLPITGLAEASERPANFIGLHFFSPVDKMMLVEIIMGEKTSDETLARAMDYVKAIRKTPITVNDSRGFYTSRVFATYVAEGLAMLAEGVEPALIDNAGRLAGMPVGPLALADEVSIELIHKIATQSKADLGDAYRPSPADPVTALMVEKLGRLGKKAGKGFYDYPEGAKKRLWPGLADHFPVADAQPEVGEVIKRLMYVQSVETARCMEEKVVTTARDADVGSILGWGFAPFKGGTVSQIHSLGLDAFIAECDRLAQAHGARFAPPALLRDMAAKGETFYAA